MADYQRPLLETLRLERAELLIEASRYQSAIDKAREGDLIGDAIRLRNGATDAYNRLTAFLESVNAT